MASWRCRPSFYFGDKEGISYHGCVIYNGKAGSRARVKPLPAKTDPAQYPPELMKRLIECVPNFSEGRDLAKVDAIVDAMSGVPGAWILDRTSDADHNRSVVTLAGEPEAVAEGRNSRRGKSGGD